MAGTVVPKDPSAALAPHDAMPTPADLEGWDSDDVRAGLKVVSVSFNERRLAVGLLLWKFRALNVDAVYSDLAAEVAQTCDVDIRTLQRWRVFAEKKWALPPPDRRTEGQRATVERKEIEQATEGKRHAVSPANSREQTPKPEKVTPDAVTDPAPAPDLKPPKKQHAQLSLFEEREGRDIVPARPPASREEVLEAKRIAKAYLDWAAQFEPTPPARPVKVPNTASEVAAFMKNRGKK